MWQYRAINLQAWWGQNIYIAFRHFDSPDGFQLKLDDVRIPSFTNADDACFVSVDEHTPSSNVIVYPNPAHDRVIWQGALSNEETMHLSDISGRSIQQWKVSNLKRIAGGYEMPLTGIETGVYMLHSGSQMCAVEVH